MKKLYNKKGKVHPSPPPLISDHLAFLPATILTLAAALSPQDREVLAYLISCSASPTNNTTNNNKKKSQQKSFNGGGCTEHPPLFHCNCFKCYTSYWVRWDASPNRQLIHDIIDAFEDELTQKKKNKKERKNKKRNQLTRFEEDESSNKGDNNSTQLSESMLLMTCVDDDDNNNDDDGGEEEREEFEKGSVSKFVSFIGETIWGVWN